MQNKHKINPVFNSKEQGKSTNKANQLQTIFQFLKEH